MAVQGVADVSLCAEFRRDSSISIASSLQSLDNVGDKEGPCLNIERKRLPLVFEIDAKASSRNGRSIIRPFAESLFFIFAERWAKFEKLLEFLVTNQCCQVIPDNGLYGASQRTSVTRRVQDYLELVDLVCF